MVNLRFDQNQRSQFRYCNPRNQFDGKIAKLGQKNRLKGRKFNKNPNFKKKLKRVRCSFGAPLNTTSYIIRLRNKDSGLKKPLFACWTGDVVDIAEEQLGVGSYGSMTSLIRVRDDLVCEDECESSVSDVDEDVEVERRLDSGLNRFEMVLPNNLDDNSDGGDDKVVCEGECESSVSDVDEHVEVERRLDSCLSRFEMVLPKNLDDIRIAKFGSDGGNDNMVCEGEFESSVSDVDEYVEVERRLDSGLSRFEMVLSKNLDGCDSKVVCEDGCESSVSDVDEHVQVEKRLDISLSRFEMVLPKNLGGGGVGGDQRGRIAKLEEENVVIKKRVVVIENELDELKRRLLCMERKNQCGDVHVFEEEVVDMKVD